MKLAAHLSHGIPALVLVALTGIALTPAPGDAQESVRVRGAPAPPATPAKADGWLGLSVLEEIGVDRGGSFTTITVTGVAPDGPAARAGLRSQDRVVRVNGRPASPPVFNQVASSLAPGETMRLTVERPDGSSREVALTAASAPGHGAVLLPHALQARVDSSLHRLDSLRVILARTDSLRPTRAPAPGAASAGEARSRAVTMRSEARTRAPDAARPLLPWLEGRSWVAGARFTPVNPELATYFEVEGGMLVTETLDATPLPSAGLRAGDVVVSVDGRPVATIDAIREMLAGMGPDGVTLTVVRHGERIELRLDG